MSKDNRQARPSLLHEWVDYWWRLLKLTVGSLAIPVALYLLLLWTGVLPG